MAGEQRAAAWEHQPGRNPVFYTDGESAEGISESSVDLAPENHNRTGEVAPSNTPQTEGETGSDGDQGKHIAAERTSLRKAHTAAVLAPQQEFCHVACVRRQCLILGLFLLSACVSIILLPFVGPLLGTLALSVLPSFILLCVYYQRHQCSTTRPAVVYSFLEAIGWMFLLILIIGIVDELNNKLTGVPTDVICSWEPDGGGKVLVNALSFAGHCSRNELTGRIEGSWDGLPCTDAPFGIGKGSLPLPAKDGSVPSELLLVLAKASVDATGGKGCLRLEETLPDALGGSVKLPYISMGERRVVTNSKASLAGTFDDLFAPAAAEEGGCSCIKQVRVAAALPAYDYCDSEGYCNSSSSLNCLLAGPHCNSSSSLNCSLAGPQPCELAEEHAVVAIAQFNRKTVLNAFIEAYFRAAFLEEMVKYLAVRRILFKDYVVDSGSLLVYGLAGAAGFATLENIQYALMHGFVTVVMRMVTSIPLHCCTGMMIGTYLGARKFLSLNYRFYQHFICAMAGPVLIHGTYDFILMLPASVHPQGAVRYLGAIAVLLLGFVICRIMWLRMDGICIVHVKDMMREGRVSHPRCCFCECDCCTAMCIQEDPMLSRAQQRLLEQQQRAHISRSASNLSTGSGTLRRIASTFYPEVPTCMTIEQRCPGCGKNVHVQRFFPSDCPYCGFAFPDPESAESNAPSEAPGFLHSRYRDEQNGTLHAQERDDISDLPSESGLQMQQQQQQQQQRRVDPAVLEALRY